MDQSKLYDSEKEIDNETKYIYNTRSQLSKSKRKPNMTKRRLWNKDNTDTATTVVNINSDNDYNKSDENNSSDEEDSDDSNYTTNDEIDDDVVDMKEYRKFLYKMFPSQYLKSKIKNEENKQLKTPVKKKQKTQKEQIQEEKYNSDDSDNDLSQIDEDDDYEQRDNQLPFNIILKFDNKDLLDTEYNESEEDTDEVEEDECEEENVAQNTTNENILENQIIDTKDVEDLIVLLKSFKKENHDENKSHQNLIYKYEHILNIQKKKDAKIQKKKEKYIRKKNNKKFLKSIKDKNNLDDLSYFKKQTIEQQNIILKKIEELNNIKYNEVPYRIRLLQSHIPDIYKKTALRKINTLKNMDPCSGEYYKIKHWVDNFMSIPFNTYKNLDIQLGDGIEKCNDFMLHSKQILDSAVYGLDDAKIQILQMLAQFISNPKSIGSAIAIQGPMGTGKTTLVKQGISKILDRPFAFIALGGATDSAFLEGHSYTYEGSTWGHIVEILKQSKCMNPVIYFDELDKVSETQKGEEIIGILTHLTDTTQNSQFHDKYFSGIDFDLSKCLFIFSYNDESKVNPILRDRMYKIQTNGYSSKEKKTIAENYLIPNIENNIGFSPNDITLSPKMIEYIIDEYANEERGVRTLKRCIETIYTKLNLFRMINPGTKIYGGIESEQVDFPHTITKEQISKLLKKDTAKQWIKSIYV